MEILQRKSPRLENLGKFLTFVTWVWSHKEDWDFTVDFRQVNKLTIDDLYPTPKISGILIVIGSSKIFLIFDAAQAYHVIPIEKSRIP